MELQTLFPKWKFTIYGNQIHLIAYKNIKWFPHPNTYIPNDFIEVYNTIDDVIEFLELNDFVLLVGNNIFTNHNLNMSIIVFINGYRIIHHGKIISFNMAHNDKFQKHNANDLIIILKETLDVESRNKLITHNDK